MRDYGMRGCIQVRSAHFVGTMHSKGRTGEPPDETDVVDSALKGALVILRNRSEIAVRPERSVSPRGDHLSMQVRIACNPRKCSFTLAEIGTLDKLSARLSVLAVPVLPRV